MAISLIVAACQTTGTTTALNQDGETGSTPDAAESNRISRENYTFFFDQGAHLRTLLEDGNKDAAAKLVAEQEPYFKENYAEELALLKQVSDHLVEPIESAVADNLDKIELLAWPAPRGDWSSMRVVIDDARAVIERRPMHFLLGMPQTTYQPLEELRVATDRLTTQIGEDAKDQFAAFDHFGDGSFFRLYPVDVPPETILSRSGGELMAMLADASRDRLRRFIRNYSRDELGADR